MQTGESLYALALAGLPADHPAVRKGVVALLTAQKPFGGWLDLNPYEQFRTPFRETQWSLIALSRLYPGPGTKGWDGPLGPQPDDAADRLGVAPDRATSSGSGTPRRRACAARSSASSATTAPLVRYAACRALARVGGAGGDRAAGRRGWATRARSSARRGRGRCGRSATG